MCTAFWCPVMPFMSANRFPHRPQGEYPTLRWHGVCRDWTCVWTSFHSLHMEHHFHYRGLCLVIPCFSCQIQEKNLLSLYLTSPVISTIRSTLNIKVHYLSFSVVFRHQHEDCHTVTSLACSLPSLGPLTCSLRHPLLSLCGCSTWSWAKVHSLQARRPHLPVSENTPVHSSACPGGISITLQFALQSRQKVLMPGCTEDICTWRPCCSPSCDCPRSWRFRCTIFQSLKTLWFTQVPFLVVKNWIQTQKFNCKPDASVVVANLPVARRGQSKESQAVDTLPPCHPCCWSHWGHLYLALAALLQPFMWLSKALTYLPHQLPESENTLVHSSPLPADISITLQHTSDEGWIQRDWEMQQSWEGSSSSQDQPTPIYNYQSSHKLWWLQRCDPCLWRWVIRRGANGDLCCGELIFRKAIESNKHQQHYACMRGLEYINSCKQNLFSKRKIFPTWSR